MTVDVQGSAIAAASAAPRRRRGTRRAAARGRARPTSSSTRPTCPPTSARCARAGCPTRSSASSRSTTWCSRRPASPTAPSHDGHLRHRPPDADERRRGRATVGFRDLIVDGSALGADPASTLDVGCGVPRRRRAVGSHRARVGHRAVGAERRHGGGPRPRRAPAPRRARVLALRAARPRRPARRRRRHRRDAAGHDGLRRHGARRARATTRSLTPGHRLDGVPRRRRSARTGSPRCAPWPRTRRAAVPTLDGQLHRGSCASRPTR